MISLRWRPRRGDYLRSPPLQLAIAGDPAPAEVLTQPDRARRRTCGAVPSPFSGAEAGREQFALSVAKFALRSITR